MGERGESESTNAAYSSLLMRIVLISCAQYGRARAKLCNKRLRTACTETLVVFYKCMLDVLCTGFLYVENRSFGMRAKEVRWRS